MGIASVVMFSGGRDSSLAACLEANEGRSVCLMTGRTGATIDTTVVQTRVSEIRTAFPDVSIEWRERRCSGIFRRIALAELETDFARFEKNLILIGHHFALLAEAVTLCAELGAGRLISGASGYQSAEFREQSALALEFFRGFCGDFGVSLETPVQGYESLDAVKYQLLDFGVTTKSLEAVSLFADSFTTPADRVVEEYLASKKDIAAQYVELKCRRFSLPGETRDA